MITYSYSLLIEKDTCDCRKISVNLPCLCVPFIQRSLHFSVRVSFFFNVFKFNALDAFAKRKIDFIYSRSCLPSIHQLRPKSFMLVWQSHRILSEFLAKATCSDKANVKVDNEERGTCTNLLALLYPENLI